MIGVTHLNPDAKERSRLARIRSQIEQTKNAMHDVSEAPLTLDDSVARAMADIEAHAEHKTLGIYTRPDQDAVIVDPKNGISTMKPFEQSPTAMLYHLLGREFLEKALRAHLAPYCANAGLSRIERRARQRELQAKLSELLDAEEVEVCALEAKGFVVDRQLPDGDRARMSEHADRLLRIWESA